MNKIFVNSALFFVLLLLLPTQLGFHFWPDWSYIYGIRIDYLSPTVYLTDIIIFAIILLNFKFLKTNRIIFLITILYSLITILSLLSPFPTIIKLAKFIELFCLGRVIYKMPLDKDLWKRALSLAVIYSSLIGIIQFLFSSSIGGIFWFLGERAFNLSTPGIALQSFGGIDFLRAYSVFSHPNSFAGFLLVCLLFLCPWQTTLSRAALFFGLLSFVLTFSQGAWFTAVCIFAFYVLRKHVSSKLQFLLTIIVATAITIFVTFNHSLHSQEFVLRSALAASALKIWTEHPLMGVGLNNFLLYLSRYIQASAIWFLQPVHNIFLLLLSETGIVGVGLVIYCFYKLLLWEAKPLLLYCLIAILLTGSLDHYWLTLQQNQILFAIILGLIAKKGNQELH